MRTKISELNIFLYNKNCYNERYITYVHTYGCMYIVKEKGKSLLQICKQKNKIKKIPNKN